MSPLLLPQRGGGSGGGVAVMATAAAVVNTSSGPDTVPVVLIDRIVGGAPAGGYALAAWFYIANTNAGRVYFTASSGGSAPAEINGGAGGMATHFQTGWRTQVGVYTHTGGDLRVQLMAVDEGANIQFGVGGDARFGRVLTIASA